MPCRVALTSRNNSALVDLRSRRRKLLDWWQDFAADMRENALTLAGTAVVCASFAAGVAAFKFLP